MKRNTDESSSATKRPKLLKRGDAADDTDSHSTLVKDFISNALLVTSLNLTSADANKALESSCALIRGKPCDANSWILLTSLISACKARFELRTSKQIEENIRQAVGKLFTQDCPFAATAAEEAWDLLQQDVDFRLSLDHMFALISQQTKLKTPVFLLQAVLKACQNVPSTRKLFESVINNAGLLHILLSLACNNAVAWDVVHTCIFELDAEDDLAKACSSTRSSIAAKQTNQNNWKAAFWPKLFAMPPVTASPTWLSMLCKMHRKRHGESAVSSTSIWFELLFHSSKHCTEAEVQDLLENGPLFYSPTSEFDVAALKDFTANYVSTSELSVSVIKQLLVVDHRCVEPHFALLLERFPKAQDLVLCLAESFAKTRRLSAWIELMSSTPGFEFASLEAQTEFREGLVLVLKSLLLEHQHRLIWKSFLDLTVWPEVLTCALEAFIFVLPCQVDTVPLLDQAMEKCTANIGQSDCLQHSVIRLQETCRKYKEILCLAAEAATPQPQCSAKLAKYIEDTANARPAREYFTALQSKQDCFAVWAKIALHGQFAYLLDLAWFFELPRMRHYFPKYFTFADNVPLDLVLRFPVGYLTRKHLEKILQHVLERNDKNAADTVAKVLLLPQSVKPERLFSTCEDFVNFVCELASASEAERLITRFPINSAAIPVLLRANPSYLYASTLVPWEQDWITAFLAEHAQQANTLWMLASCLNVAKQQQSKPIKLDLNIGLGLQLALDKLDSAEARAFCHSLGETFYLFDNQSDALVQLLFAFTLELAVQHGISKPFQRMLEKSKTQHVAKVIDTMQAYAWSLDVDKQVFASRAMRVLFEFGVRGNFETIVKRRTRQLWTSLSRLCQVLDDEESWRALCAFAASGGIEHVEITSRDLVVILTATVLCKHQGKMRFLQIMLESFPQCVAGDASATFVRAIAMFERHLLSSTRGGMDKTALLEFTKVCEKLKDLEKTFRHHAVSLLGDHVALVLAAQAESGGAAERKFERIGFFLLDLCGEYELNQLNAVLGNGVDDKQAAERRRYVKNLCESHAKNHVFKGKI